MLGRGLESLIPNKSNKESGVGNRVSPSGEKIASSRPFGIDQKGGTRNDMSGRRGDNEIESVFQIEIEKIKTNPHQPRKDFDPIALQELASSIREYGILQPLVVSKKITETERGTDVEYELIAGERRWQASRLLGLQRVPAIVRAMPAEQEKLEMALVENIQRENLNPMEMARAYAKLQDIFGLTQREVAVKVGKSRETVANVLRLLNLPTHIQESLSRGQISESQARLLLSVNDLSEQEKFFKDITENNVSVRDLKVKVARVSRRQLVNKRQMANSQSPMVMGRLASAQELMTGDLRLMTVVSDPEIIGLQDTLENALGTKVKVEKNGAEGNLIIKFSSPEELQELVKKLMSEK